MSIDALDVAAVCPIGCGETRHNGGEEGEIVEEHPLTGLAALALAAAAACGGGDATTTPAATTPAATTPATAAVNEQCAQAFRRYNALRDYLRKYRCAGAP